MFSTYSERGDGKMQSRNHGERLQTGLKNLRDGFPGVAFSDVNLKAGDYEVKAHRIILAAGSDYFKACFSSAWKDSDGDITFHGVTSAGLKAAVEYLYTGSFHVDADNVESVLEAARHFIIPKMTKMCASFLEGNGIKSYDDALRFYQTANDYELDSVKASCIRFLNGVSIDQENYLAILDFAKTCESGNMVKNVIDFLIRDLSRFSDIADIHRLLDDKDMVALLRSDPHGIVAGEFVLDFLQKWIEHDPEKRRRCLPVLFEEINLAALEVSKLQGFSEDPLIKNDEACLKLIEKATALSSGQLPLENQQAFLVALSNEAVCLRKIEDTSSAVIVKDMLRLPCTEETSKRKYGGELSWRNVVYKNILYLIGLHIHEDETAQGEGAGAASSSGTDGFLCCYSYDPNRNRWKKLANLQGIRSDYQLVAVNGRLYVLGGKVSGEPTERVDVYTIGGDCWNPGVPLPFPITSAAATILDLSIYLCGGRRSPGPPSSQNISDQLICFDTADRESGGWQQKKPLSDGRCQHKIITCRGRLYMFGGKTAKNEHITYGVVGLEPGELSVRIFLKIGIECYKPETNEWTTVLQPAEKHLLDLETVQVLECNDELLILAEDQRIENAFLFNPETNSIKHSFAHCQDMSQQCVLLHMLPESLDNIKAKYETEVKSEEELIRSCMVANHFRNILMQQIHQSLFVDPFERLLFGQVY